MGAFQSSDSTETVDKTTLKEQEIVKEPIEQETKIIGQETVEITKKLVEKNHLYLITIDDENVGIFENLKDAERYVMEFSNPFSRDPNCYFVKVINDDQFIITHKIMNYSFNYLFNYDRVVSTICIHKIQKMNYE